MHPNRILKHVYYNIPALFLIERVWALINDLCGMCVYRTQTYICRITIDSYKQNSKQYLNTLYCCYIANLYNMRILLWKFHWRICLRLPHDVTNTNKHGTCGILALSQFWHIFSRFLSECVKTSVCQTPD